MADRSEAALAAADEAGGVPGRSRTRTALGHRSGVAGMKQCT